MWMKKSLENLNKDLLGLKAQALIKLTLNEPQWQAHFVLKALEICDG